MENRVERIILTKLFYDEEYLRKVIPFFEK